MKNKQEVLEMLSSSNEEEAKRNIFKFTDCGAWIEFDEDGIKLGSIVEGSEGTTETFELKYPFTETQFDEAMEEIEYQVDSIYNEV